MQERELRLDELVDCVVDLQPLQAERIHLTDVEAEKKRPLTENLRLLSVIASLGPGELGLGTSAPALDWGPLRVLEPVHDGDDELYLAREESSGRKQWLRLLPAARLQPNRGRRDLDTEAETLAEIDDPRLAQVRGAGSHQGRTGIWADASDGQWMSAHSGEPMEWAAACDLVADLAELVTVMHARGLIHRRLTPNRILQTSSGPILLDLGGLEPPVPGDDSIEFAPEVLRGAAPTVRADVYSLGSLLFRFAGFDPRDCASHPLVALVESEPERRPSSAADAAQLMRKARNEPPSRSHGKGLRKTFKRILRRKPS